MSVIVGMVCTTSPIDDGFDDEESSRCDRLKRPAGVDAALLLRLCALLARGCPAPPRHQHRVEARVVVHLELAIHLEIRAAGLAVGEQLVESPRSSRCSLSPRLSFDDARCASSRRCVPFAPSLP